MRRAFVTLGNHDFSTFDLLAREVERQFEPELRNESYNALETDGAFLVALDIPGVNYSDIDINIEENKLSVSAERKNPFMKNENVAQKYQQTITLPKTVDLDKIIANYENGVLNLTLPKIPEHIIKKKIEVSNGQTAKSWTNFLNFKKSETETAIN